MLNSKPLMAKGTNFLAFEFLYVLKFSQRVKLGYVTS